MKKISLTRGLFTTVDDDDFEALNCINWYARNAGGKVYAANNTKSKGKTTTHYMHRVLVPTEKGMVVDHIDGDTLNNTRGNLRACTHQENMRNRKTAQSNSMSGIKGVSWHESSGKWRAVIKFNGKHKHIGSFLTKESAAEAYRATEISLFGKFAA